MSTPGWYPDPEGRDGLRWWDGQQWTDDRSGTSPTPDSGPPTETFDALTQPVPEIGGDQSERPSWWQASDGKWYPPEPRPDLLSTAATAGPFATATKPPGGRPIYRRPWFVVAAAIFVVLVVVGVLAGQKKNTVATKPATTTINPGSTTTQSLANLAPVPTIAPTTTAVPATTAPPTTLLSVTTVAPPTVPVTPPPAAPPTQPPTTPAVNLCGAPQNPMGYNFCGRGTFITSPDPSTCNYFNCIANFSNGKGYMVECADAAYSMSGGRSGACSSHGGVLRPVYSGP